MKFVERTVLALLVIAMLVAMHQIAGLVFATHGWKGLAPSDWAAWVQAVGSIAAIAVAMYLSNHSLRHAVELDRLKQLSSERSRLRTVCSIMEIVYMDAIRLNDAVESGDARFLFAFDPDVLADNRTILEGLPKFDIPDAELSFKIIQLCRLLKFTESFIRHAKDQGFMEQDHFFEYLTQEDISDHTKTLSDAALFTWERSTKAITILGH